MNDYSTKIQLFFPIKTNIAQWLVVKQSHQHKGTYEINVTACSTSTQSTPTPINSTFVNAIITQI